MENSFKIQLNSLEALERLIGGDSEFEIEIRKSIAYDFANKHLKGMVSEEVQLLTKSRIKEVVTEELIADKNFNYALSSTIKNRIKSSVQDSFRKELHEAIKLGLVDINKALNEEITGIKLELKKIITQETDKFITEAIHHKVITIINAMQGV